MLVGFPLFIFALSFEAIGKLLLSSLNHGGFEQRNAKDLIHTELCIPTFVNINK